jgi:hypothetical protein
MATVKIRRLTQMFRKKAARHGAFGENRAEFLLSRRAEYGFRCVRTNGILPKAGGIEKAAKRPHRHGN